MLIQFSNSIVGINLETNHNSTKLRGPPLRVLSVQVQHRLYFASVNFAPSLPCLLDPSFSPVYTIITTMHHYLSVIAKVN